jgi:hypothetical protein
MYSFQCYLFFINHILGKFSNKKLFFIDRKQPLFFPCSVMKMFLEFPHGLPHAQPLIEYSVIPFIIINNQKIKSSHLLFFTKNISNGSLSIRVGT